MSNKLRIHMVHTGNDLKQRSYSLETELPTDAHDASDELLDTFERMMGLLDMDETGLMLSVDHKRISGVDVAQKTLLASLLQRVQQSHAYSSLSEALRIDIDHAIAYYPGSKPHV